MYAVCSPLPSQATLLGLFIDRIAQLAEAESIAVMEVISDALEPIVTCGTFARVSSDHALLEYLQRLEDPAPVPAELEANCVAAPIFDPGSGKLTGAVLLVVEPGRERAESTLKAADLLAAWGAVEIDRRRELAAAKALSARHVQLREQDRLSLATRIHDDLSQNITFMRLSLASLERQASRGDANKLGPDLRELSAVSRQTAESVQNLSMGLRPAMIETVGPAAAIRHQASLFAESAQVAVDCQLTDLKVSGPVSLAAFRILEYALENIGRHASAHRVTIRFMRRGNHALLKIEDDGRGFDVESTRRSLGLCAMAERAEIAGGSISIESSPGRGTTVTAIFPASGGAR